MEGYYVSPYTTFCFSNRTEHLQHPWLLQDFFQIKQKSDTLYKVQRPLWLSLALSWQLSYQFSKTTELYNNAISSFSHAYYSRSTFCPLSANLKPFFFTYISLEVLAERAAKHLKAPENSLSTRGFGITKRLRDKYFTSEPWVSCGGLQTPCIYPCLQVKPSTLTRGPWPLSSSCSNRQAASLRDAPNTGAPLLPPHPMDEPNFLPGSPSFKVQAPSSPHPKHWACFKYMPLAPSTLTTPVPSNASAPNRPQHSRSSALSCKPPTHSHHLDSPFLPRAPEQ